MRTNSRSRGRGLVLAVLTMVVSLPELARAQQTGLFPLAPIRRQRVPCDQEDPIYKIYKHQYFGYHPDVLAAVPGRLGLSEPGRARQREIVQGIPTRPCGERSDAPPEGEAEEGMDAPPAAIRPAVPAIPGGARSPFDEPFDTDRPATPPRAPRGGQAPLPTPPGDPFELDKPDAPATPRPGTGTSGGAWGRQ